MIKKIAEKFIWQLVLITNGKQIAEREETVNAIDEQSKRFTGYIKEHGYLIVNGGDMNVLLALTKAKTPEEAKNIVDEAIEQLEN